MKIHNIIESIKRFVDKGYDKKLKNKEAVIDELKKLKKRKDKIEKLLLNAKKEKAKELKKELEIIKKLRKKAKKILNKWAIFYYAPSMQDILTPLLELDI